MKTQILFALLLSFSYLAAQTPISNIINEYSAVEAIDYCEGKIKLANNLDINEGDFVLIIQMKGATISESNSSDFGNIQNIGSAGLYEKVEIKEVDNSDIYLKHFLINQYDISGLVQIVTIPKYENAIVTDTLKGSSWNGTVGGVITFKVENLLTMNAPISASEIGFRGGIGNVLDSDCSFFTNANNYFYGFSNWRGAPKGEGIAHTILGKESGRGAQANGGGGGNDHNAGGGGGGNISVGGIGGEQDVAGFGCQGNFPGRGGKASPNNENRIYLGGGGGAGHTNNVIQGKTGGSGGGIIIIFGNSLDAQGQKIIANGGSPVQSSSDGGAGGGAGGSIILGFENIISDPVIEILGGNGGSILSQTDRCFGPGGGGSGGRILMNQNLTTLNLQGGEPGVNIIVSNQCNGPSNEAAKGENGLQENYDSIFQSNQEILDLTITQQPENQSFCINNEAVFTCGILGTLLTFQWQIDQGSGFENLTNSSIFEGVNTKILIISIENFDLNNSSFRCLILDDCNNQLISEVAQLEIIDNPIVDFQINQINDFEFQFLNLSQNTQTIQWDFGDSNFSSENAPFHTYLTEGEYTVTLTISNDCGTQSIAQIIQVGTLPVAQFNSNTSQGCAPTSIQFFDTSLGNNILSWNWSFEGADPTSSTEQNPVIFYENPGIFDVLLIVENQVGKDTLLLEEYIKIEIFPSADFTFEVTDLTVLFENTSNGGIDFMWDFGDGTTSTEVSPQHTYLEPGIYEISLTATSFSCGSTIQQTIVIMPNSIMEDHLEKRMNIYPNPAFNMLYVEFPEALKREVIIQIYDAKGSLEKEVMGKKTKLQKIDLANLEPGIYWIQVTEKGKNHLEKIVILSND